MKKKQVAYKLVVRRDRESCEITPKGNQLVSYLGHNSPLSDVNLEYKPRKTTRPQYKESKLFVFKELSDARFEHQNQKEIELWECWVNELIPYKEPSLKTFSQKLKFGWKNGILIDIIIWTPVKGTYFAGEVTLKKRIG